MVIDPRLYGERALPVLGIYCHEGYSGKKKYMGIRKGRGQTVLGIYRDSAS